MKTGICKTGLIHGFYFLNKPKAVTVLHFTLRTDQ